ncbi:hypothetical protein GA707_14950 [Nostocoides sp. F2B08]|uniref:hypothetical protein n=1 Tax=Nostocoides sp. F2B08 TaxID=2653936 RepID=UPI001263D15F|nr:hypothetical protein [Tetrasphaera sp. F2B08]KAB7742951.1 hypothetical protein GA707_14950 [Tetrasphaera sp. F2B08]
MPTADDALAERPRRVLVAGVSGAGKSTLACRVADTIGALHIEMDGLVRGRNWTERTRFAADVERFSRGST